MRSFQCPPFLAMYLIKNYIQGIHSNSVTVKIFAKRSFLKFITMKLETTKKVKTVFETYVPSKAIQKLRQLHQGIFLCQIELDLESQNLVLTTHFVML